MSAYCGTLDVYYLGGYIEFQQLGFPSVATFNNWMNGTLIPKAQAIVDNYVGHNFSSNSGTILLDGNGKESLPISRSGLVNGTPPILLPLPLRTLTSVKIDSGSNVSSSCKTYDTHVVYDDQTFCEGRQNVEIQATWGYSSVPHDIQAVTAQICANFLHEAIRSRMLPDLITPIMEAGGAVSVLFRSPRVITVNERSILDRYRYRELEVG